MAFSGDIFKGYVHPITKSQYLLVPHVDGESGEVLSSTKTFQQNSEAAFTSTTEVDGERNIRWLHKGRPAFNPSLQKLRFTTSPHLLQLFMWMLQHCEAPEMFYWHETSPDSPLGLGWVDNAWIFPFLVNSSFNVRAKLHKSKPGHVKYGTQQSNIVTVTPQKPSKLHTPRSKPNIFQR